MVNLAIFALFFTAFVLTRKREGTAFIDGFAAGLTCAKLTKRVGILVIAYRPNRVYWKLGEIAT